MVMIGETRYFGIWVQKEEAHFWIADANGGEQYIGTTPPTEAQITEYRDRVIR